MSSLVLRHVPHVTTTDKTLGILSGDRFLKWFTWISQFAIFVGVVISATYLYENLWEMAHFVGAWLWFPWVVGWILLTHLRILRIALINSKTTDLIGAVIISSDRKKKKMLVEQLRDYLPTTVFGEDLKKRWQTAPNLRKRLYWTFIWHTTKNDIGITFDAIHDAIELFNHPSNSLYMHFQFQLVDEDKELGMKIFHRTHPDLDFVIDCSTFLLPVVASSYWIFHALAFVWLS